MKNKLFGLAAVASVSLALLTGCPAEEKQATETTTTTTTTETTTATGETATGEGAATGETAATGGTTTTAAAGGAAVDAKAIFAQKCSGCHGANGGGGMGPALGGVEAKGDEHIRNIIANGSPEKGMPAFAQQLSEAELTAMVDYVKSL